MLFVFLKYSHFFGTGKEGYELTNLFPNYG